MDIRIAYLIDTLNIGGTEKQLIKQIELLESMGYSQTVICLRSSEYLGKLKLPCTVHVINVSSLISYSGVKRLVWLVRFFRSLKIDVVQTYFIDSNIFGVLAAKIAGVKNIISCRRDMGFWYTPRILAVMRITNALTDRILVNSNAIKENVHKFERVNLDKIDVIYNGINLEIFSKPTTPYELKSSLGIPHNNFIVGIVANLNRSVKRVDVFVEAAALMQKTKNTSYVIVGDGHLRLGLEQQVEKMGIASKVFFVGFQDDIIPYLQIFNVGVLTSESEGFPNSILEYMAAGLPVVCIDSGGTAEIVKEGINGFLLKSIDASMVAKTLDKVFEDKELQKTISKKNLEDIKKYSWDYTISKLDNYLRELVEK